jgi:kynurenine 3-monooxygenase
MLIKSENQVVVVGAGLVGSLLSTVLAKLGFDVEVYERRVDMRQETISAGRSINLAMSVRGFHALQKLGVAEKVRPKAIAMPGRIIHPVSGPTVFQRYGKDDSECIYSIGRSELNKILMSVAESSQRVKLHFQEKLVEADLKQRKFKFKNEKNHQVTEVQSKRVFGTDGSSSILRQSMRGRPEHQESESVLNYGYKELSIAPGKDQSFQMEKHGLHIWPRGAYMLIALPNFDGSFTCTLFLSHQGEVSFETLNSKEKVQHFFETQFPDVVPLISNLVDQFFQNPTGQMVTVKCAPWNSSGDAVLLGDAAHAIVPFFGQGMNCGFEDVAVLWELLENSGVPQSESDWNRLLTHFSEIRKPNADAIADLAVDNFVEMRDKVADSKFLLAKEVEKRLEKQFPGEYISRYRLVSFTRVPYRVALEAGWLQDKILKELCEGIKTAEDVDLIRARELIQKELAPLLKKHQQELQ